MYYITLEEIAKMAGLSEEELATAKKNFEDYIKRAYEVGYDDGIVGNYEPDDINRMVEDNSQKSEYLKENPPFSGPYK